ncbi:Uncharacterised protein [Enterocloster clostridioformis]|uniref:Uncharacterized protein n=1 Tax=Enterocloster clostridioformis TaxID=1531 RepID=A0A2X2W933_9FIRM|nr:Uncharacterised protein [Enterocloster clostridioformis]
MTYAQITHYILKYVFFTYGLRICREYQERKVIPIKTRADIYGHEATELLRIISMYPGLSQKQLCQFYPGRTDIIKNLLSHLERQGRIILSDSEHYFLYGNTRKETDNGIIRAVWVLLDFIEKAEYHSSSDFPVKIVFFSGGELYEIVQVTAGQEALVTHALHQNHTNENHRIVLVDDPGQIPLLEFPGITGFCTVDTDGNVSYYKKTS